MRRLLVALTLTLALLGAGCELAWGFWLVAVLWALVAIALFGGLVVLINRLFPLPEE